MGMKTARLYRGQAVQLKCKHTGHLHTRKPIGGIIQWPGPNAGERETQKETPCWAGGIKGDMTLRNGLNLAAQTFRLLLGQTLGQAVGKRVFA